MSIEKEKEMFEAWYEKHHNGRQISRDYVCEDNSYSIGYANAMWISWQASAKRQGYKLVPVDPCEKTLNAMWEALDGNAESMDCIEQSYKAMIGEETK